tara:strand:+ start:1658 stop:2533 length:876 start_codon:yes stop_codon:yes gene_type:complete
LKNILIFGATSSGKTSLSISLAKRIDAEIINLDSRLFYKGMNIGTAKPSEKEMQNIPHHLIDFSNPGKQVTAGEWHKRFQDVFEMLQKKKKNIILVGGTGFYARILLEGWDLGELPPDEKRRKELLDFEKNRPGYIYNLLKEMNFEKSKMINERDFPRLIRAIEIEESGPDSFPGSKDPIKLSTFYLDVEKENLDQRIFKRTNEMLRNGLEEEARFLWKKYPESSILSKTIGYAEFSPSKKHEEAFEEINQNTIRLAKKQRTWARGLSLDFEINGSLNLQKQVEFILRKVL